MFPCRFILALIILCSAWIPAVGAGATATFQQGVNGYSGVQDTQIFSVFPNRSYPQENTLLAGNISGSPVKSLMRFDLSSLAGQYASITSITLNLVYGGVSGSGTYALYPISSANDAWNANPEPTAATWAYEIYSTTPWSGSPGLSTPGVDYSIVPLATGTWSNFSADTTVSLSIGGSPSYLKSLVDSWASESNPGFVFDGTPSNDTSFVSFYSSEATAAQRPKLTVDFVPVPEPSTALLVGAALAFISLRSLRRQKTGGQLIA